MSSAGESRPEPASENKPLGAPRGKRPRIRISCVDQLGTCRCHHGHKPGDVRVSFAGSAALAPGDPLPDVIIHGHTHVPELKTGPDARPAGLYLCPGAVYRPRSDFGRTIAKMDVEAGRILHTWVKNLDGKVLMEA